MKTIICILFLVLLKSLTAQQLNFKYYTKSFNEKKELNSITLFFDSQVITDTALILEVDEICKNKFEFEDFQYFYIDRYYEGIDSNNLVKYNSIKEQFCKGKNLAKQKKVKFKKEQTIKYEIIFYHNKDFKGVASQYFEFEPIETNEIILFICNKQQEKKYKFIYNIKEDKINYFQY